MASNGVKMDRYLTAGCYFVRICQERIKATRHKSQLDVSGIVCQKEISAVTGKGGVAAAQVTNFGHSTGVLV
jgi:hypothetical protein